MSDDSASGSLTKPNITHEEATTSSVESSDSRSGSRKVPEGSRVEYYGAGVNFCGYCKSEVITSEGRRSYDMRAHRLTVSDYQKLLDRGWRRSGTFCYHPSNATTCCPNFPLSCDAINFELSKSQKRCIERLNSFLITGDARKRVILDYGYLNTENLKLDNVSSHGSKTFEELKSSTKARDRRFVKSCTRKVRLYNISLDEAIKRVKDKSKAKRQQYKPSLEDYLYPTKEACSSSQTNFNFKHRLELRVFHVDSIQCRSQKIDEHLLMQKYQKSVHKEDPEEWTMSRFSDFLVNTPLINEPIIDRDFPSSQSLSRYSLDSSSYDDCTDSSNYPLVKPVDLPTSYGTYHCSYHLDGKLIAVGVLDVIPKCVTTVYFFYDTDYAHLNLGIYSALIEISMVRRLAKHYSGQADQNKMLYYYMGFYVHECKKMHYKTRFRPSYLLCSETWQYVPTEICLKKLVGKKYSRFAEEGGSHRNKHKFAPSTKSILDIPVIAPVISNTSMQDYLTWLETNLGLEYADIFINNYIVTYLRFVGTPLSSNITLELHAVHGALVARHQRLTASSRLESKSF